MVGLVRAVCAAGVALLLAAPGGFSTSSADTARARQAWPRGVAVVGYESPTALWAALARHPARVLRRIPALEVVEVQPRGSVSDFAGAVSRLPGIAYVQRLAPRVSRTDPALAPFSATGLAYEWQYAATRADAVPSAVLRAASAITIAVVDTGADLGAPDLAAKTPSAYSVATRSKNVRDGNGHGTFVASLAAGSVSNREGIAGFGGDARLLVVQAGASDGSFSDVDTANGIVYAVEHGARVINLSFGGREKSRTEQRAIDYAVSRGALLVAAGGNEFHLGNPVEYPAAYLQPEGSQGRGGRGLAVTASDTSGRRAGFSNTGSWISLAAPGVAVFGAVSAASSPTAYPRVPLPGSTAGLYGFASGTSFAAPQVAGAAALVWAANPALSATQVAEMLEETASGRGAWNSEIGFGVIDVAGAVAKAQGGDRPAFVLRLSGIRTGRLVRLTWEGEEAPSYRLFVRENRGPERVLLASTPRTSVSYSLVPGHVYAFRVAAIDVSGAPTAASAPLTVRLVRASSSIALRASRTEGVGPLRVELAAVLRSARPGVSTDSRTIVFEWFGGERWRRAGRATTDASGHAAWSFTLGRGSYRVRARFAGAEDLARATSRPIALRVR